MKIIGIDPGFALIGFGIIEKQTNCDSVIEYGYIETEAKIDFPIRLSQIKNDLEEIIKTYTPTHASVEKLFFNKNTKTAMKVAQARGVIIETLNSHRVQIHEFTPLEIKVAITGYGKADKSQVQNMTKTILKLHSIPKPDDTADALAAALCLSQSLLINKSKQLSRDLASH